MSGGGRINYYQQYYSQAGQGAAAENSDAAQYGSAGQGGGAAGQGGEVPAGPDTAGQSAWKQQQSVIDVQKANDAAAANQTKGDNGFFKGFMSGLAQEEAYAKTASYQSSQESALKQSLAAQGLTMQEAPQFGGQNYASHSATQLRQMVTTNMDASTVGTASSSWNNLGNTYETVAQSLGSAAGNSEYGWQGQAGDATRDFLSGMAKWAGTAGQGAQLAGNQMAAQSEAASTVHNSVPASPAEPPSTGDVFKTMLSNAFNPAAGAQQLNQQFAQAQQDHTAAVQAVQTYDSSLASSGSSMPAFNAPPTFNPNSGGPGVTPPTSGGGGIPLGPGSGGRAAVGGGSGVRVPSSTPGGGGPGGGYTPPSSVPGSPGSSTSTSAFTPPSAVTPPNVGYLPPSAPSFPGGGGPDPVFSGTLPLDGAGGFGGAGGGFGGAGGGFSGGGGGSGLGGGGGRSGLGGAGRAAAEGEAGGAGARSGAGSSAAGKAAGAAAAEEAEGAAGKPGSPGSSSAPRGGSGGKGGEDKEHKTAQYLQNADPDATFGTDEKVAPPVIGER